MDWENPDFDEETEVITQEKITKPPMYKVLIHNDDYTTMEFVVFILETVFHKSLEEAIRLMLMVHNDGVGICGVYTSEVAETKIQVVHDKARENGFPLKCSMEEE